MLDREWLSVYDPGEPNDRYLFDMTFLLSAYQCVYGAGCPGTQGDAEAGCCGTGAYYTDAEDRCRVEAAAASLDPATFQHAAQARRHGVTARAPDGSHRTRVTAGACIFLNRSGSGAPIGCALHHHALARGEHHMAHKPEVCWIVPLRREVAEDVGDDGRLRVTTTITSYDRGAWGPGGADFQWWCTEEEDAFVADRPVYKTMEAELRAMVGDAVYAELAAYLDDRRGRARRPLPLWQP